MYITELEAELLFEAIQRLHKCRGRNAVNPAKHVRNLEITRRLLLGEAEIALANEFDLSPARIYAIGRQYGHYRRAGPYHVRNREIVDRLTKTTDTLEVIGADYGVTRERIRQIGLRNRVVRNHVVHRHLEADRKRQEASQRTIDKIEQRAQLINDIRRYVEKEGYSLRETTRLLLNVDPKTKRSVYHRVATLAKKAGIVSRFGRWQQNRDKRKELGISGHVPMPWRREDT